eukprot:3597195-Amphidinium_carterae.2
MQKQHENENYSDFYKYILPRLRRSSGETTNDEKDENKENEGERGVEQGEAPVPEVPDTFEPFNQEQRKTINDYTEAYYYYSKALQYTLTKVTKKLPKVTPYRFVVQCNHKFTTT